LRTGVNYEPRGVASTSKQSSEKVLPSRKLAVQPRPKFRVESKEIGTAEMPPFIYSQGFGMVDLRTFSLHADDSDCVPGMQSTLGV
jgi:hypothetical protein